MTTEIRTDHFLKVFKATWWKILIITLVIVSMAFHALLEKYTNIMVSCMIALVTHSETSGAPL